MEADVQPFEAVHLLHSASLQSGRSRRLDFLSGGRPTSTFLEFPERKNYLRRNSLASLEHGHVRSHASLVQQLTSECYDVLMCDESRLSDESKCLLCALVFCALSPRPDSGPRRANCPLPGQLRPTERCLRGRLRPAAPLLLHREDCRRLHREEIRQLAGLQSISELFLLQTLRMVDHSLNEASAFASQRTSPPSAPPARADLRSSHLKPSPSRCSKRLLIPACR